MHSEFDCSWVEFWFRRVWSGIFYWRIYRRMHPNTPFYTPQATRMIEGLMDRSWNVFEWGSGRSSLWYAERAGKYFCVEHDRGWYNKTAAMMNQNLVAEVEMIYSPQLQEDGQFFWEQDWPHYKSLGRPPGKPSFRKYMAEIDRFPDGYFDCIVLDGRERLGCAFHAVPKLKQSGILVLDDSLRRRYRDIFAMLGNWHTSRTNFGLLQTTVFRMDGATSLNRAVSPQV